MKFADLITACELIAGGPGSGRHKEFYHGTSDTYLKSIAKNGLTPSKENSLYISHDAKDAHDEGHFTVAGNPEDLGEKKGIGGKPIILVLDGTHASIANVKSTSDEDPKYSDSAKILHSSIPVAAIKGYVYAHPDLERGANKSAKAVQGKLHLLSDLKAGGPGSGWTTENGHTKHITAKGLTTHLQSISKNPLPKFVHRAAALLEASGLDKRYFESRSLTKFRVADKLAIHPLAIANYNESKRLLEFRKDVDSGAVTHELAHHLDLTFTRQPNKQAGDKFSINKEVAAKVISDYTAEWQKAKDSLSEALGHRFNFTNDYQKMENKSGLTKNLPTLYAADSPKEWFAESFFLYAKGGQSRERLERLAPLTAAAVKTVMTGRIFK